jgi:hypothetical protein
VTPQRLDLEHRQVDTDAPPDAGLLADAVEALEAGRLPREFALEEVCHLLRARPLVARELRRRGVLRTVDLERERDPHQSAVAVAKRVALRLGVPAETVRSWMRLVGQGGCSHQASVGRSDGKERQG